MTVNDATLADVLYGLGAGIGIALIVIAVVIVLARLWWKKP